MRTWVTTSWMYKTFGQSMTQEASKTDRWSNGIWQYRYYNPNYDKLQEALNDLTSYCERNQYSIKAIIPLTAATTFEYGQSVEYVASILAGGGVVASSGIGQGWAFSHVIGFAALLEHVENVSEEEYERRLSQSEPSLVPA